MNATINTDSLKDLESQLLQIVKDFIQKNKKREVDSYNANLTWSKKIFVVLTAIGEGFTDDIVNVICEQEPELKRENVKERVKYLCSQLQKKNELDFTKHGNKYLYRLKTK